jgi:glycerol-3-phosphate dehydrogenase
MNRNLAALTEGTFDLLVIGGGIFGAGVARDAALRGLRVALIDKADFASGTSSRSSKLIHGGLRYLEQYAFGLVAEACRERETLLHIAPHLVRPLPFLFPVYEGDARSFAKIRLGATLYDLIARSPSIERHQSYSPERALMKEPALSRRGLRGAVRFLDCQEDDARFCLDNIIHAAECGAVCANYCELLGFVTRENRLVAATVVDRATNGDSFEIHARAFVNAAGPWVDRVANLTPFNGRGCAQSPTKGVHLLLPRLTQEHAIAFQARADGRVLFVMPWGDCSLVGTTDTDWRGDPADVRADPADIEYLLREIQSLFPQRNISESDIITTFAGVRSLLHSETANPSARSREHQITQLGQNLLSIAGGKYTTYRAIATSVVDQVYGILGSRTAPCRTAETLLPQHRPLSSGERIAEVPAVFASDIVHACDYEMVMTVSDVMRRRTSLALSRHGGVETAGTVARLIAEHLGWSDTQMYTQLQQYIEEWKRSLP